MTAPVGMEKQLDSGRVAGLGDFGGLSQGEALAICTPRSREELRAAVVGARARRWPVTLRGLGRSQSGQSVPDNSVLIDMSGMNGIQLSRERRVASCEPGTTFRQVLDAALPAGLAPPVCPLNLDLSIGGVMSAGGLGSSSHRAGFAVSHVAAADVMLASGETVRTGPDSARDLYDCVFGGVGGAGIIASVDLELDTVPERLDSHCLLYADLESLIHDQLVLAENHHVLHLDGMCSAATVGLRLEASGRRGPIRRWSYALQVSLSASAPPDWIKGLRHQEVLHTQVDDFAEFATRYDLRFEMMRATGAWTQLHPWFEAFIPLERAQEVVQHALQLPAFLNDVVRVAIVDTSATRPLALAVPKGSRCATFALLPMGVPEPLVGTALACLQRLDEVVVSSGGKRYLSGWLSRTDEADWVSHHGAVYPQIAALRRRFDPDGSFRSRLRYS